MEQIITKDKASFMKIKHLIDGMIFWREVGDKVEIKIVSKRAKAIVAAIPD